MRSVSYRARNVPYHIKNASYCVRTTPYHVRNVSYHIRNVSYKAYEKRARNLEVFLGILLPSTWQILSIPLKNTAKWLGDFISTNALEKYNNDK